MGEGERHGGAVCGAVCVCTSYSFEPNVDHTNFLVPGTTSSQARFKAEAAAERRRLRRELETIDRVERKVTKGGRVAIGRYALEMANNNAKAKATAKPPDGPPPMVPMPN